MLRQLTVPKVSLRVLELRMGKPPVQQTQQGLYQPEYEGRDRQKWSKIARKLLAALGEYDELVQERIDVRDEVASDSTFDDSERAHKMQECNYDIKALDNTLGAELTTIILESDEFSFIDEHWWKLQLPSDRESRRILDPIDAALEPYNEHSNPCGWREVRVENGEVVLVESGERPVISSMPKPNHRKNVRELARRQ